MRIISTLDSHTAGEATRLVTAGLQPLRGQTMAEKLADAQASLPWAPGLLLREPRGHKDLYGAILTSPCRMDADVGLVFMDNQGYEPMCGHAVIGVVTCLLETGMFQAHEPETTLRVDTAAGLVVARARVRAGRVVSVAFDNVPSFAIQLDFPLQLPDGRRLMVDVAFGGNFFVMINAEQTGLALVPANAARLAGLGMQILTCANQQIPVRHPDLPHIDHILDARFYQQPGGPGAHGRNVVILGDHMLDRSPCGTGTCAELAVRYARGQIGIGEAFVTESILGTRFTGYVLAEAPVGSGNASFKGIIPRIEGQAYLIGLHQFIQREDDPFPEGFILKS